MRTWNVVLVLVVVSPVASAYARDLEDVLVPPSVRGTAFERAFAGSQFGTAISTQVANQIPTVSTSAGYTYEWNPELESLERSARTFGPIFTERGLTIGRNKFNLSASYSWLRFDKFSGKNLDHLTNHVEVARVPETGTVQFLGPSRVFDLEGAGDVKLAGDQLTLLTVDFIGRSEFAAQGRVPNTGRLPAVRNINGEPTLAQPLNDLDGVDAIGNPVDENDNFKGRPLFIDIERNDILDLAVGGRFAVGDMGIFFANFLVPLNDDGLRAEFVPTVGFEKTF